MVMKFCSQFSSSLPPRLLPPLLLPEKKGGKKCYFHLTNGEHEELHYMLIPAITQYNVFFQDIKL